MQKQRGISLLESLIALLIAALGILGVVSMQMRALTDTQAGVRRGQAIHMIEDLAERIRSNPNALAQMEEGIYTKEFDIKNEPSNNCTRESPCSPKELAELDIYNWHKNLESIDSSAKAIIFRPKDGSRHIGVIIGWRENKYTSKESNEEDGAAFNAPLLISAVNTDDEDVECPEGLVCHLQYIDPNQRCSIAPNRGNMLFCPN